MKTITKERKAYIKSELQWIKLRIASRKCEMELEKLRLAQDVKEQKQLIAELNSGKR